MKLPNIPVDKQLHFAGGVIIALALCSFSYEIAMAVVVIAGVGKELMDMRDPENHTAEFMDAAATILGGIVGTLYHFLVIS